MTDRFGPRHLAAWRRDGGVLIENFFTPAEVEAVRADFVRVFGRAEGADEGLVKKTDDSPGRFHPSQFAGMAALPLDCSPALNLIGVHPAMIAFAQQALSTTDVHLYEYKAWAKFTGDADYDQPFHCDFTNHTLVAPAEDAALNSVTILCYFSDVTDAHGAMHYVTRPDSDRVAGPEASQMSPEPEDGGRLQEALRQYERSSAARAGSAFFYSIDLYHRGTNMTAPKGHRYAVLACFRAGGNDAIGHVAWPAHHGRPWDQIFDHATPEQLACFGVKPPGHPYWTKVTLARAQARYPGWNLTPYRLATAA